MNADYQAKQAARDFAAKQLHATHKHLIPDTGDSLVTAAKNIRIELSRAFPGVKFAVKTKRFSGGNDINVRWTDGPTTKQVEEIAGKYQGGSFDGMTDCYNYERGAWTDAFGQGKYVFCNRDYTERAIASGIRTMAARYIGNLHGVTLPTPADWQMGRAWSNRIPGLNDDMQTLIGRELSRRTWAIARA